MHKLLYWLGFGRNMRRISHVKATPSRDFIRTEQNLETQIDVLKMGVDDTLSEFSMRISGIETKFETLRTEVKSRLEKIEALFGKHTLYVPEEWEEKINTLMHDVDKIFSQLYRL